GGHHGIVVGDFDPPLRSNDALLTVDRVGAVADMQFHFVLGVPFLPRQHQFFSVAMREERSKTHTVVGRTRFLTERDDSVLPFGVEFDQSLAKSLADHTVADDNDVLALRLW